MYSYYLYINIDIIHIYHIYIYIIYHLNDAKNTVKQLFHGFLLGRLLGLRWTSVRSRLPGTSAMTLGQQRTCVTLGRRTC